jgi:hypothetical protein
MDFVKLWIPAPRFKHSRASFAGMTTEDPAFTIVIPGADPESILIASLPLLEII